MRKSAEDKICLDINYILNKANVDNFDVIYILNLLQRSYLLKIKDDIKILTSTRKDK